jgi:4-hydroxy-tetrahydrodipicolinate reductase
MNTTPLRIVVAGATGRMGRTLLQAIAQSEDLTLTAALASPSNRDIGRDTGEFAGCERMNIALTVDASAALSATDALVDFSTPNASVELAQEAARARVAHVIGTTGFNAYQENAIVAAARDIPIVKSGNMSVGVALLAALVKQAAKTLPDFDIEIVEFHHRMKRDAPSGTALLLGQAAADAKGVVLSECSTHGRQNDSAARQEGTIGFASLRGGTVVGEHSVIFAGPHERIQLSHISEDRLIFARGALVAARWLQGKPPGLYTMADVLALTA